MPGRHAAWWCRRLVARDRWRPDVKSVARDVLRHRLMTNFAAEAADRTAESVVAELVDGGGWAKGA